MRKILSFVFMALALVVLCVSLAACGDTEKDDSPGASTPSCQHQWEETGREPATCAVAEKIFKKCTLCGRRATSSGNRLPHTLVNNVCTVCGYVQPREVVQEGNLIYTYRGSYYSVAFDGTPSGNIVVAATVDGCPVTSLSNSSAFKGNAGITSMVLPNIEHISDSMFEGCTGLRSVVLGDGVQSVGTRAFHSCTSLQSVTMTESVRSIGASAFGNCGSLQRMVLPFVGGSPAIKDVQRNGWAYYDTYFVFGYIFGQSNYNGAQKIRVCHDFDPWGEEISSNFYIPASLSYVEILSGSYESGSSSKRWSIGAFAGCTMIRELVLPKHAVSNNAYAFRGCTGVTTLTTGSSFAPAVFPNVTSLTLYNVSDKTAFSAADYAKITNLVLHYSASTKSLSAASLAAVRDKISALYLSSHSTEVESGVLSSLGGLKKLALPYKALGEADLSRIESLEILSGESYTIGQLTLSAAVRLQELTLDSHCTVIAANAFQNCTALRKVTFDGSAESLLYDNLVRRWILINFGNAYANPLAHGASLYFETKSGVRSAQEITLSKGTQAIGAFAFYGCANLKELTFDRNLSAIGEHAFGGVALNSVTYLGTLNDWCGISFANGEANPLHCAPVLMIGGEALTALGESLTVQVIPAYAFYGYSGLELVILPDTVTRIGTSAFENCVSLSEVTVPGSLTVIEMRAFGGCTALTSALFEVKTGWARFESSTSEMGHVLSEYYLTGTTRAAEYLCVTYTDYIWKKVG